jgi:hypothetical protein
VHQRSASTARFSELSTRPEEAGILWCITCYRVAHHGREQATNAYAVRRATAMTSDTEARLALYSYFETRRKLWEEVHVEIEHPTLDTPPPKDIRQLAKRGDYEHKRKRLCCANGSGYGVSMIRLDAELRQVVLGIHEHRAVLLAGYGALQTAGQSRE